MNIDKDFFEQLKIIFKPFDSAYLLKFSDPTLIPIVVNDSISPYVFSLINTYDYKEVSDYFASHYLAEVDRDEYCSQMAFENVKSKLKEKGSFSYRFQRLNLKNKIEDLEVTALPYSDEYFILVFRKISRRVDNIEVSAFRVIYETLGGGIFTFDLFANGKVRQCMWSSAFRKIAGFSGKEDFPDELGSFLRLIYVEDRINFIKELKKKLKVKNSIFDFKFRAFTKNKIVHWFRIAGITIFSSDNKPEKFFGSIIAIDLQVKHRKEIERVRDEHIRDFYLMGAISDVYNSMHLIDLKEDFVIEYSSTEAIRKWVKYNENAANQMKDAMTNLINKDYVQEALDFTDLKTLSVRMRGKNYIAQDMLSDKDKWLRGAFILVEADEKKEPVKVLFTSQKIQEEKEKERLLILKSNTDELTGFLNRRAFIEDVSKFNKSIPSDVDISIVMMDLNGLKQVNDTYGHDAGDKYLKEATSCMKETFGSYGHIYRIGGDEFFAILFADENILNTLKDDFEERCFKRSVTSDLKVSVSSGYVMLKEFPDYTFKKLLRVADERMYRAKADYYSKEGNDRREIQEAFSVLCSSYINIFKINLSRDVYTAITTLSKRGIQSGECKGFFDRMILLSESEQVHDDCKKEFKEKTGRQYLTSFFSNKEKTFCLLYKGRIKGKYINLCLEIIPAKDFSLDNKSCYLYVREVK